MSGGRGPGKARARGRVARRTRRRRPPHSPPAHAGRTHPLGRAGGRPGPGGPATPRGGCSGPRGCHGAGPRSALGPRPNLSRRRRGGANLAARGSVLLGKFGRGWGLAGAPPTPALVGASPRGRAGVRAAVRRCGQPANQWHGPRPGRPDVAARPAR